MSEYKNRIVGFQNLPVDQVIPNPKNWRTHPDSQAAALRETMQSVGIVDAALVRVVDDDQYMLIDGHLRHEQLTEGTIPCLILDLDEEEADRVLLTFDPITELATMDSDLLFDLANEIDWPEDSELGPMIDDLLAGAGASLDEWTDDVTDVDAIEEYDAEKEHAIIKIKVPRDGHQAIADKVKEVLADVKATIQIL